jgi:competence protein ComEA
VSRTRAVALALLAVAALAAWRAFTWPGPAAALDCAPGAIHLDPRGVAVCAPGAALPAGQVLTLGGQLVLATASAEELALIPGISRALAERLVEARTARGGFRSWAEVDQVQGVGPGRLARLQQYCLLSPRE